MLKKSLIFGSAALFLIALIALTGCSQATGSDKTVTRGENHLYGEADPVVAQGVVSRAAATGRPVVLGDGLKFVGTGVVDFGSVPIQVEGTVTVDSETLIVNTAKAAVTYGDGAVINVLKGYYVYNDDGKAIYAYNQGKRVLYTTNPMIVTGTADHIAVDAYEIGGNFLDIKTEVATLIILDKLTVTKASTPVIEKDFINLGTVDVTGTTTAFAGGRISFWAGSTLTSTNPENVTITLPTEYEGLYNIKVENKGITLVGGIAAAGEIYIGGKIEGPGLLTIKGDATNGLTDLSIGEVDTTGQVAIEVAKFDGDKGLVIAKNAGSIDIATTSYTASTGEVQVVTNTPTGVITFINPFTSTVADFVKADANDGAIIFADDVTLNAAFTGPIKGSGKVVFSGVLTPGSNAVTFDTNVVFENGLIAGAGVQKYNGNVDLAPGKTLNFSTEGTDGATFKAGKTISVAGTPVLKAGGANGLKTFSLVVANPSVGGDDDEVLLEEKPRTLYINGIPDGATGTLAVVSGGILQTAPPTGASANIDLSVAASLAVEAGGEVRLVQTATVAEVSKLLLGPTASLITIGTGTAPGTAATAVIAAEGGTVTFSAGAISGAAGARLALNNAEGDAPSLITVAPVSTTNNLTVTSVDVLISEGVTLTLTGDSSADTVSKLTLAGGANPGKLTFGEVSGTALTDTDKLRTKGFAGVQADIVGLAAATILTEGGALDGGLASIAAGAIPFTVTTKVGALTTIALGSDTTIVQ
jgi:hypothetical protein